MTASAASGRVATPARLSAGTRVGTATVSGALRVTAMAEVYSAQDESGNPCTLHVVHPALAKVPAVRQAVLAAAKTAVSAGDHKHLVRTHSAGVEGDLLWVLADPLDGSTVKDLLARKRQSGGGGFGARGAGNLVVGVAAGLAAVGVHGGLSTDSVVVSRSGRVRVCDFSLGSGLAAAVAAGAVPAPSNLAPEIAKGGPPSAEADVYGLGALLYEALVGKPLERGGPRPSEAVAGLTTTIDEIIARSCAPGPDKRFSSIDVMRELVADALGRGAAVDDDPDKATPAPEVRTTRPSLSQAIANPSLSASLSGQMAASAASSSGMRAPAAAAAVDPALTTALADTNEKWLVAKGRLDYGPFSLQGILDQINRREIIAGNILIDKDTGNRFDVAEHPLLGPLVDQAKQVHDDARRANAEVAHHETHKKKSVILFVGLGVALVGIGVAVFLIFFRDPPKKPCSGLKADSPEMAECLAAQVAGVDEVGAASLDITISKPKKPPPEPKSSSGGRSSGGTSSGGASSGGSGSCGNITMDLEGGGDDGGDDKLSMDAVFSVYSRYGSGFGRCIRGGSTTIWIEICGKTGKVGSVKVNGGRSGGTYDCINKLMRSMQFPKFDGLRTRAEFEIGG